MNIWLIGSGGVRNIATKNESTMATRRFSLSPLDVTTPNHPRTNSMSGSWKTSPNAMIVLRTMDM